MSIEEIMENQRMIEEHLYRILVSRVDNAMEYLKEENSPLLENSIMTIDFGQVVLKHNNETYCIGSMDFIEEASVNNYYHVLKKFADNNNYPNFVNPL